MATEISAKSPTDLMLDPIQSQATIMISTFAKCK